VTAAHRAACVAAVALLVALQPDPAGAHSGLRFSSPLDGATLGDTPAEIQLTFVERPEPALSTVRIIDTDGTPRPTGRPALADGDPLTLSVPVQPLGRGVYTVHWRAVSAVDGHASSGAFVFGILVSPASVSQPAVEENESSAIEAIARTIFLIGLLMALGAVAAGAVARAFPFTAAAAGTALAAGGLMLLVVAQLQVAQVSVAQMWATTVGGALIDRTAAVAVMTAGLMLARHGQRRGHRIASATGVVVLAVATLAAMVAHGAAGHAAAGRWPVPTTVAVHVGHIAAGGIWLGGLAALLMATRRHDYGRVFGRFSLVAGAGLAAIVATGIARSIHEIPRWADLLGTRYGVLVAVKVVLLAIIAALGARNFFRNVARAETDAAPLRRAASAELMFAVCATAVAGLLGTLPPPAGAGSAAAIEVSGHDFGTTVRATLQVMSDQPGPNRFTAFVADYDAGTPAAARAVRLRFTPIDDAGVTPTTLDLRAAADNSFTGAGANLAFPGRWRINMLVERAGDSVDVPLELEARGQPQSMSVLRPPRQPVSYTAEVGTSGFVRIEVDSEREGPRAIRVTAYDIIYEPLPIEHLVVTIGEGANVRELAVARQDRHRFSTVSELHEGRNRIAVIARTDNGARLHAIFVIDAD
jgi:copper transport protein